MRRRKEGRMQRAQRSYFSKGLLLLGLILCLAGGLFLFYRNFFREQGSDRWQLDSEDNVNLQLGSLTYQLQALSAGQASDEAHDHEHENMSEEERAEHEKEESQFGYSYVLRKSSDGGTNWEIVNEDPFASAQGAVYGMEFLDRQVGFFDLLNNETGERELYATWDGGLHVSQISLPLSQVKDLGEQARREQLQISDFTYIDLPKREGKRLLLRLSHGRNAEEAIRFLSEDQGRSWHWDPS